MLGLELTTFKGQILSVSVKEIMHVVGLVTAGGVKVTDWEVAFGVKVPPPEDCHKIS